MTKDEVLGFIEDLGGKSVRDEFDRYLIETGELPLEDCAEKSGLKVHWKKPDGLFWGCDFKNLEGSQTVQNIILDGPAYKCGLNHGDEIIGAHGWRLKSSTWESFQKTLKVGEPVEFLIARQGKMLKIDVSPEGAPKEIEKLEVVDQKLFKTVYLSY